MRTTLIAPVLVALACCAGFIANTFDARAIEWQRIYLATLGIAPLLPALAMLAVRRGYALGVAYSSAGGLIGALMLALPAGVLLLFIGFASGPAQQWDTLLIAGYEISLIGLGIAATFALFRQPSAERAWLALLSSGALVAAYSGFVIWLTSGNQLAVPYDREALIREHNDGVARSTVAAIADCARRHAEAHLKTGVPASLAEIEHCVGAGFQSYGSPRAGAEAAGYRFFYFAEPRGLDLPPQRFAICARPIEPHVSGSLVLGINPMGMNAEFRIATREPASCFDVWAGVDDENYLAAITACLMSLASTAPERGYPQGFGAGGDTPDHGLACAVPIIDGKDMRILTARGVIEYSPELPDATRRVRHFALHLFPSSGAGPVSTDETGAMRRGVLADVPPTLEAVEAARPAEGVRAQRIAVRRNSLTRACHAGDLDQCDALGDFEWEHGDPIAGQESWDEACERGRLMSCLYSARFSPLPDTYPAQRAKERCRDGEARSCQQLDAMLASWRVEVEQMRASGGRQIVRVRGQLAPPGEAPPSAGAR